MESRLTGIVALLRRSVLRVLAKVFAGAVHLCYGFLEWVSIQLFVDTAETTYLDRHGNMWGVPRKAATFATGSVYFTGTNATVIPSGTRIQNADGIEYETLSSTTIAGTTSPSVTAQALEPGAAGNNTSLTVELISPIVGVDSVTAVSGFSGGQDQEADSDYRDRILARIQNPPMGGNAADYIFWAEEVSGVDKAWCFPLVNGDGTVGVVIKAVGTNPVPSDSLLSEVYEHIFDAKPIGATLVDSVTRRVTPIVKVDVIIGIETTPYNSTVDASIKANIQELFDTQAAPGQPVLISQLRDAISNSGVTNYEIIAIMLNFAFQDVNADISFTGYEYGVIDGIYIGAQ
jgi:uncharacterized phage protein gp47/JayE